MWPSTPCSSVSKLYETTRSPVADNATNKTAQTDARTPAMQVEKKTSASAAENAMRFLTKPITAVMTEEIHLNRHVKSGDMQAYLNDVKTLEAKRSLANHDVKMRMNMLPALMPELPASINASAEISSSANQKLMPDATQAPHALSTYDDMAKAFAANSYTTSSSKEICAELADAIDTMSKGYLDVFHQAVEKYGAFYQDFSDFMTKLKSFIEASDDKTILDAQAFKAELDKLIADYKGPPKVEPSRAITLFPVQDTAELTGATKAECEAWAKELGLNPANTVTNIGGDKYVVHFDVSPLQKIYDSLPVSGKMECNSAQWAAWQTGVDMQKDTIQTGMQTLTQKYSNANSTFDNLIKILSSTIASLLECDKAFL